MNCINVTLFDWTGVFESLRTIKLALAIDMEGSLFLAREYQVPEDINDRYEEETWEAHWQTIRSNHWDS